MSLTDDEVVRLLITEFDMFCVARHRDGEAQYGATGFISHNMFDMIVEELADAANYLRYQYVKIRLLERSYDDARRTYLSSKLPDEDGHEVSHDPSSFIGAGGLQEIFRDRPGLQDLGQRSERADQPSDRGPDNSGSTE